MSVFNIALVHFFVGVKHQKHSKNEVCFITAIFSSFYFLGFRSKETKGTLHFVVCLS